MNSKLPDEVSTLLHAHPDLRAFELMVPDINGILRGKRIGPSEFASVFGRGFSMPGSTVLLDAKGRTFTTIPFGASDGDPDVICSVVPGSVAWVPWAKVPVAQALLTMSTGDGEPYWADPRNVLKKVLARFTADGLRPVIALELEFYLLDGSGDKPQPRLASVPGTSLEADGPDCHSLDELRDHEEFLAEVELVCQAQNIPVGTALSEYGPGQFEVNLHHVDDAVLGCDHAILLKRAIKNVAHKSGLVASFMAKPFRAYAGCGTHIHVSVLDAAGGNIFAAPAGSGAPFADTLRHAIGGLGASMAESMAIFAPNANSYRRFRPGFFAPVNPNWGINHRGVSLRIPMSGDKDKRLEHRVAGADCNPYLLTAAVLAGIHHGIASKTEPGPMVKEGEQASTEITLPLSLREAIGALEQGSILPGYLGEQYVRVFAACRREEGDRFSSQVTDRDYEWYLRTL